MILADDFTDNYANATTNFNSSVSINKIGLQQGTDRTVYIEWQWGQENSTKEYKVIWYYRTSNGTTFNHESKKGSRLLARAVVDNMLNITLFATVMKKKSQQQVINTQNYEM